MSRKVFISFLGTNNYLTTHYEIDGIKSTPVRFIQEALLDRECVNWTNEDAIFICMTEKSKQLNWLDNGQPRAETEEEKIGLRSILEKKQYSNIVNEIDIDEGFSEKEIWTIFDCIYAKLREDDVIYLDVTHAFRSIPLFSVVLFNYARFMKKVHVVSVLYGAFEKLGSVFEVKKTPLENRVAPVVDLTNIIRLQSYTNIAYSFSAFGRLNILKEELSNDTTELSTIVKNICQNINDFDNYITACRMTDLAKGTWLKKINSQMKSFKKLVLPLPVKDVIQQIVNELNEAGFVDCESLKNIEGAIKWTVKYEMLPQAFTFGREYILTLLTIHFINYNPFDTGDKKQDSKDFREYMSAICSIGDKDIIENNFKNNLAEHLDTTRELLNNNTILKIRPHYLNLSTGRNIINHAKGTEKYQKLRDAFIVDYTNCINLLHK